MKRLIPLIALLVLLAIPMGICQQQLAAAPASDASAPRSEVVAQPAESEPEEGESWTSVMLCVEVVGNQCKATSESTTLTIPKGGSLKVWVTSANEWQKEEVVDFQTSVGNVRLASGQSHTWTSLAGGEVMVTATHGLVGHETQTPGSCYAHAETAAAPPTPTPPPSETPTPIPTGTPTSTPEDTPTETPTNTPAQTSTATPPATATSTATPTSQPTASPTPPGETMRPYCWKVNFDLSDGDTARAGGYFLFKMELTESGYQPGAILDHTFMKEGWTHSDMSSGEWLTFNHTQIGPFWVAVYYLQVTEEELATYDHVDGINWVNTWIAAGRDFVRLDIVNYPDNVSWLKAGICHAIEVGWPD